MLRDLIRRSAWLSVGAAVGRLLPVALLLAASRRMDTADFTSASAGFAWAGVAVSLTSTGPATVMAQRMAASGADGQVAWLLHHARGSAFWSAALAAGVAAFGDRAGAWMFGATLEPAIALPAAVSGALWSQVALCVAALNGSHRPRLASTVLAACGLLQGTAMAVALAGFGWQAVPCVWGLMFGSALALAVALACVALAFDLPRRWRPGLRATLPATSGAWRNPVLWNTVAAASATPIAFFAAGIVARGPDGARQLAQYFALEQIHQLLVYVPALVGQAFLPLASRGFGRANDAVAHALLLRRLAWLAAATAGAGMVAMVAAVADASWFAHLLSNPAVTPDDPWPVRWMLLNASLALGMAVTGAVYLGSGHLAAAGLLNLAWGANFLGLAVALADHGNAGLQAARFASSAALEVGATAVLIGMARHRLRAAGPFALTRDVAP